MHPLVSNDEKDGGASDASGVRIYALWESFVLA